MRALFAEFDEDRGDVVFAAAIVGEIDQRFRRGVAVVREERGELFRVVRVAGETVRAETEAIAGENLDDERVDLDALVHADGARDRVLLSDLFDLLARELAALDELVEDGVILGDLLHVAAAHHVDAAVADVRDEALLADDDERRQRRAHAALGRVVLRFVVDARARASARRARAGRRFARRDRMRRRSRCSRAMSSRSFLISSWTVRTAIALATSPAA